MMFEYIYVISLLSFTFLLVFLLTRIKVIPTTKTGFLERFGVYYKPVTPGFHFLIPFVDRMVVYEVNRCLNINREIIKIDHDPRLSLSLQVQYKIIDEKDFHEQNVDQFMQKLIIEVAKGFISNFGTSNISQQKVALVTRIKGAIRERELEWGIEFVDLDLLMVSEIPTIM
ncbi:MAG: SPFH domain-containing protein [Tenericutes bacterium]|jgi:regulator of protease activity HflC (stomatin/prohibitin superfamily)|nr:SPFH domain-containing protein [Mycoplasmatota bacterium]